MPPPPLFPAPACWWRTQVSGLLRRWRFWLGAYSVGFFSSQLCCPLRFQNSPQTHLWAVSCCLETSPTSRLPPQDGSLSLTLLYLFLSFIFCPTSFQREWPASLGAWCPPQVFTSCFVEVAHHSDDLLMNLWGRKWSPLSIPPPSWDHPPTCQSW